MKIIGLIAEFNPFHNGHAYLIQQIRERYQADVIICVMSGHFLQRGEPAIVDKWTRAKIACLNDVDIVIELPYVASVQPADIFAQAALNILNHCGITHLAFGCEDNDLTKLIQQAQLITLSQQQIYTYMQQGDNYAQATKKVLPHIQLSPNNILALSYIKAIQKNHPHIQPIAIQRLGSHYHDKIPQHQHIASATAIRHLQMKQQDISDFIPQNGADIFLAQEKHCLEQYWLSLKTILARTTPEELSMIYDIREGLEHRLLKYWAQAISFRHFISLVSTKRYSHARIQRCCCHILTHTTQQLIDNHQQHHFQVLALSTEGRHYLKHLKKVNTLAHFHTNINQKNSHYFAHDIRVTQIYSLPDNTNLSDLTQKLFIK